MRYWLIILVLVLWTSAANAQQEILLNPIFVTRGEISTDEPDRYSLVLREGAMISLRVQGLDGLDPSLTILDPSGTQLLIQDDFSYPDITDVQILAFSAPRTGTYRFEINRYGQTSGEYELTVAPGYLDIAYESKLESARGWTGSAQFVDGVAPALSSETGLRLSIEGISQLGIATNNEIPELSDFYLSVDVTNIEGRNGWQAGIQIRANDEGAYLYQVDHRGFWRFSRLQGNSMQTLRDWTAHPAIQAGATSFRLGILANGNDFDFFYGSQYVGTATDNALTAPGRIGLAIGTSNAIGSRASMALANLAITLPPEDYPVPSRLLGGSASVTMRELKRHQLVPSGGEIRLTLSEASANAVNPGIARFALGRGATFADFVLSATLRRNENAGPGACGMILRDRGENDRYIVAYADRNTGYGLAQRNGEAFSSFFFDEKLSLASSYNLLILAIGERVMMYLDGYYAGEIVTDLTTGGIGQAIVNFEQLETFCQLRDLWIWSWN